MSVARGSVYFVLGGEFVKVGWSTLLRKRLGQLRSGSPVPLTMLGHLPACRPLERELHEAMAQWRRFGEWFAPNPVIESALTVAFLIGSRGEEPFDHDPVDGGDHYLSVAQLEEFADGYRNSVGFARRGLPRWPW